VDSHNAAWRELVLATRIRGDINRGASPTDFGRELLASCRKLESDMGAAAEGVNMNWLEAATRSFGELDGHGDKRAGQ